HASIPGEEEQLAIYRDVLAASPNHAITIRTLDIGGDKTVPFLGREQHEANPFMGWRSIRLSFEHPNFFLTQLRAILRAGATAPFGDPRANSESPPRVQIMVPMVTSIEELPRVRSCVRRAERQLREDKIPFSKAAC